jgi:fructose-1,6-bisphosphatase/inositol monophosphatase family enzyme
MDVPDDLPAESADDIALAELADDFALAGSLVRAAGELAARMLADGLRVEHKTSITDVVSAADRAAESLIVERLRAARPDDGIVGEEGAARPGARTWYLDPVDGTYNFLAGLPTWCSALALTDADGVVLGAVYQPTTGELWLGGRDRPTTRNGLLLPPLDDRPLAQVSLASYLHPDRLDDADLRGPWLAVLRASATLRVLGSGSVELAAVAAGRLGVFAQLDCPAWDWLPGEALVRAAGGDSAAFQLCGHTWYVAGPPTAVADVCRQARAAFGSG